MTSNDQDLWSTGWGLVPRTTNFSNECAFARSLVQGCCPLTFLSYFSFVYYIVWSKRFPHISIHTNKVLWSYSSLLLLFILHLFPLYLSPSTFLVVLLLLSWPCFLLFSFPLASINGRKHVIFVFMESAYCT
jgi:hypothetical protein